MPDKPYSRRDFLLSVGMAGAAGAVLSACSGERPPRPPDENLVEQPPPVGDPPATPIQPDVVAADCTGYDQLTADDLATRSGLQYTDRSPEPGQFCHNCQFRVEAERLNPCLGCQLFAGPVAPQGWCAAWAAAA